jgi:hypothetical protein
MDLYPFQKVMETIMSAKLQRNGNEPMLRLPRAIAAKQRNKIGRPRSVADILSRRAMRASNITERHGCCRGFRLAAFPATNGLTMRRRTPEVAVAISEPQPAAIDRAITLPSEEN